MSSRKCTMYYAIPRISQQGQWLEELGFSIGDKLTIICQKGELVILKAYGKSVQFGRPEIPYPDNFREIHRDWKKKKMTLQQAADACGMPVGTFYGKARKFENST